VVYGPPTPQREPIAPLIPVHSGCQRRISADTLSRRPLALSAGGSPRSRSRCPRSSGRRSERTPRPPVPHQPCSADRRDAHRPYRPPLPSQAIDELPMPPPQVIDHMLRSVIVNPIGQPVDDTEVTLTKGMDRR